LQKIERLEIGTVTIGSNHVEKQINKGGRAETSSAFFFCCHAWKMASSFAFISMGEVYKRGKSYGLLKILKQQSQSFSFLYLSRFLGA
jgi:hypothetical protein